MKKRLALLHSSSILIVLLSFLLSPGTIGSKRDYYYDNTYSDTSLSSDDEVEYFDSTQTTPPSPPHIVRNVDTDIGAGVLTTTGPLKLKEEELPLSPLPQIQTVNHRRPSTSFDNFPSDSDRDFDTGFGFRGTENRFVEVRIGEFSTTEQFARVFGRLTNYTGYFDGEALQVSEFTGVPFAEPPVKQLRFQRTILKTPPDEFIALRHPESCPQINSAGTVTGNEDCLHLSIYVPRVQFEDDVIRRKPLPKMPVLVWFHGESSESIQNGKYSILTSGSSQDLDPFVFLQNKIIVVTPQYRLGTLGYLSVANEDLNGNMGLLDQMTALEWVQRYITYFGGDPNQITVMGQGSSATTLGLLSTTTSARSLFHRMILMSGSATSPLALDANQKLTYLEIARENNCPSFPTLQLVRCMQKKGLESIVKADQRLVQGKHLGKFKSPLPVIQKEPDDRFLPPLIHEDPKMRISKGKFQNVPLIIGVTSSEMSGFLSSLSGKPASSLSTTLFSGSNVLRHFIRQVLSRSKFDLEMETVAELVSFEYFAGLNITERREHAKDLIEEMFSDYLFYMPAITMANMWSRFAPVYFYVYDYVQTGNTGDASTFNDDGGAPYRTGVGNGRRRQSGGGSESDVPPSTHSTPSQAIHGSDLLLLMQGYKGSAQDRQIANIMIDAWSSFIHKGSPFQSGLQWSTYGENTKEYLYISERIQMESRFRARQEQFWNELLKRIGEKSVCSTSSPGKKTINPL